MQVTEKESKKLPVGARLAKVNTLEPSQTTKRGDLKLTL